MDNAPIYCFPPPSYITDLGKQFPFDLIPRKINLVTPRLIHVQRENMEITFNKDVPCVIYYPRQVEERSLIVMEIGKLKSTQTQLEF